MTGLKIPYIDLIFTPRGAAFCFKRFAKISEPDLFAHSFWNCLSPFFWKNLCH